MGKTIVVAGSNFGGYTAALKLKEFLKPEDKVIVISNTNKFLFTPSLIWVPFGLRNEEDITFDLQPIYKKHDIQFVISTITRFEPESNKVITEDGPINYDYLLIATGPKPEMESITGIKPGEFNNPIVTLNLALQTKQAWQEFLKNPGPVVVGATQGAACFGAAYEFLFNIRYQLFKHNIDVPLTFVTAEPFLTHFGIGGFGSGEKMCQWMFDHYKIHWKTDVGVQEICENKVKLTDGTELESKFSSFVPKFVGIDAVRNSNGLSLPNGFIETTDDYRHKKFNNIYAAGVAVQVEPPSPTNLSCGVPRTGYPTEEMAQIAAWNISCDIYSDRKRKEKPFSEYLPR